MGSNAMNWPFFIGAIAIGILSAIWIFRDARSRDYNPLIWAIICIFLAFTVNALAPLVVVAVYLFLRPRGELLTCPHCCKRYVRNLAFCPHCGKPVKKECLKCHDLMELDQDACPHCGMRSA